MRATFMQNFKSLSRDLRSFATEQTTSIRYRSLLEFHRREPSLRGFPVHGKVILFGARCSERETRRGSRRACTRIGLCPPMVYTMWMPRVTLHTSNRRCTYQIRARISWPKLSAPRFLTSAISHRSALEPHPCIQPGEAQRLNALCRGYVELCGSYNREKTLREKEREAFFQLVADRYRKFG